MVSQVVCVVYFTVLDIFSRVQRVLPVNKVVTLSTSVRHILVWEGFYLKITVMHMIDSYSLRWYLYLY